MVIFCNSVILKNLGKIQGGFSFKLIIEYFQVPITPMQDAIFIFFGRIRIVLIESFHMLSYAESHFWGYSLVTITFQYSKGSLYWMWHIRKWAMSNIAIVCLNIKIFWLFFLVLSMKEKWSLTITLDMIMRIVYSSLFIKYYFQVPGGL